MRVLVTGGAGFIGSHIVDRLVNLDHQVSIVDDFSSGSKENINSCATIYSGSILEKDLMERIFRQEKPEVVFHAAAQSFVSVSTKKPEIDAMVNVAGSVLLLDLATKFGTEKIVYSNSGGASYGNPNYLPIDENHPINPISQYGISKHTVEHYLQMYKKNHGLDFTSLRYSNIYGPRQNPYGEGGVVAIFGNQLLRGERPTIFGDGSQVRDYCFVHDVVDSNTWALNNGSGEAYNVGSGISTTTQEIFELIKKKTGSSLSPIYAPERIGDAKACVLDSSKLQKKGWKPKYGLEEGVEITLNYLRGLL